MLRTILLLSVLLRSSRPTALGDVVAAIEVTPHAIPGDYIRLPMNKVSSTSKRDFTLKPMNVVITDGFNNSSDMRGISDLLLCPHCTVLHPTTHPSLTAESVLQQESLSAC